MDLTKKEIDFINKLITKHWLEYNNNHKDNKEDWELSLNLVKKLTIPVVGCQREQLKTTKDPFPYDEWKKHLKIQKPNNQIYQIGDDYITLNEVLEMYEDYYHSF